MLGNFFCLGKVGSTFQTYGERVQARPPSIALAFLLDALVGKFLGYGRDYRTIQTAREQYAIRHVTHQLSLDGRFECIVNVLNRCGIVLHGIIFKPVALVPAFHYSFLAAVVVSRKEWLVLVAEAFESLQFAGTVDFSVLVATDEERNNADRVACNQKLVLLLVVEGEGEDSADVFEKVDALFLIESKNHLAV